MSPGAIRDRRVVVADGSLAVRFSGEGGCAVIAIHGWTLNARIWRAQHDGLGGGMSFLSFDRRGFGGSTTPPALGQEPGDVGAVLDAFGIGSAWILGQSQGARVALAFALAHPERVRGLVLQGAPPLPGMKNGGMPDIPLADYAAAIRAGDIAGVRREWLAHPLMHTDDPVLGSLLEHMVSEWSGEDLINGAAGLPLRIEDLASIACPTLVLTGAEEHTSRQAAAQALAAAMPSAVTMMVPRSGHLCNAEQPAAFNAAVADFITRA